MAWTPRSCRSQGDRGGTGVGEAEMRLASFTVLAAGLSLAAASGALGAPTSPPQTDAQIAARVAKVLAATPLIDGHNDFPWEVRERWASKVGSFDMKSDLAH